MVEKHESISVAEFTMLFQAVISVKPSIPTIPFYSSIWKGGSSDAVALSGYWRHLEKVFRVPTFNPRNTQNLITELYLQSPILSAKNPITQPVLPTEEGFEWLNQIVGDTSVQTVILKGRRGSGKTNAINFYLNKYFKTLCDDDLPATFFRVDVAKLYAANSKESEPSHWIGVREYMEAHAYFVILRYAALNSSDFAMKKYAELDGHTGFVKWILDEGTDATSQQYVAMWVAIVKEYEDAKSLQGDEFSINLVRRVLRRSIEISQGLHRKFIDYIRYAGNSTKTDEVKCRVLKIVDAIDNVRLNQDRRLYENFLRELLHYRPTGQEWPKSDYDISILAMRPETLKELSGLRAGLPSNGNGGKEIEIEVLPTDFRQLIAHKFKKLEALPIDSSDKPDFENALAIKKLDLFSRYSRYLTQVLIKSAPKTTTANEHNTPSLSANATALSGMEYLFYDNLRSFSRNVVRAAHYIDQYRDLVTNNAIDSNTVLSWVSRHKRLLLEGSVLAGSESFPTNFEDDLKGRWCPNFFEFEKIDGSTFWGGLTLLRVLQILETIPNTISSNSVVLILNYLFGYPKASIESALRVANQFALIEIGGIVRTDTLELQSPTTDQQTSINVSYSLQVTKKGSYIKNLAFSNATVAYLMALTTPLLPRPKTDDENEKFLSWQHARFLEIKQARGSSRRFHESTLRTLVYLLRHINWQHSLDMNFFPIIDAPNDYAKTLASNREKVFGLPDLTKLGSECWSLFKSRREFYAASRGSTDALMVEWGRVVATTGGIQTR